MPQFTDNERAIILFVAAVAQAVTKDDPLKRTQILEAYKNLVGTPTIQIDKAVQEILRTAGLGR